MRQRFLASLLFGLTALPVVAQESDPPSLMERGVQQFLEGLLLDMEPAFDGLRDFLEQMGPTLTELMGEIEDWSVYEAPELLPNGDIIIRRKPRGEAPAQAAPPIEL